MENFIVKLKQIFAKLKAFNSKCDNKIGKYMHYFYKFWVIWMTLVYGTLGIMTYGLHLVCGLEEGIHHLTVNVTNMWGILAGLLGLNILDRLMMSSRISDLEKEVKKLKEKQQQPD